MSDAEDPTTAKPPPGTLTESEAAQLTAFVNSRWLNKTCPQCGKNRWDNSRYTMMPLGDPFDATQGMPFGVMLCRECGNAIFVNLFVAKVFTPGQKR